MNTSQTTTKSLSGSALFKAKLLQKSGKAAPITTPSTQSKPITTTTMAQKKDPTATQCNGGNDNSQSQVQARQPVPIDLPLINTISLLLTSYQEQDQSKLIGSKLAAGLCVKTGSKLNNLAQKNSLQQRLTQNNNNSNPTTSPLQSLLQLRSEPVITAPDGEIKNMNMGPVQGGNSNSNSHNNSNNNNSNNRLNKPTTTTNTTNTTNTTPPTLESTLSPYASTSLLPTDPILLYASTRELGQLRNETTLLSSMLYKFRSQQRRQVYFSMLQRTARKARVVMNQLIDFSASYYTLIYSYFDAIHADVQAERLRKARGGNSNKGMNNNTTNNTNNNTTNNNTNSTTNNITSTNTNSDEYYATTLRLLRDNINSKGYSGPVLNLFGSEYSWEIYQTLSKTYYSLNINTKLSQLLNSTLILFITALKTVPALTQMVYSTYLLPFCYTAAAIVAKIITISRSILLLFYPLYISSTPQHLYFPSQLDKKLQSRGGVVTMGDITPITTPSITTQQLWHYILKFQIDLPLLQAASFQSYFSSTSIDHKAVTNELSMGLMLEGFNGDNIPPQIQLKTHHNLRIPSLSHSISLYPARNDTGIKEQGVGKVQKVMTKAELKQLQRQMMSNVTNVAKTTNTTNTTKTTNTSNTTNNSNNITKPIQDNTTPPPTISIATHYANYLKLLKLCTRESKERVVVDGNGELLRMKPPPTLITNPLISIPPNKLPQLLLRFCHPNGAPLEMRIGDDGKGGRNGGFDGQNQPTSSSSSSSSSSSFSSSSSSSSSLQLQPRAFTAQLSNIVNQLIDNNPFQEFNSRIGRGYWEDMNQGSNDMNQDNNDMNQDNNDNHNNRSTSITPSPHHSQENFSYLQAQEVLLYLFSNDNATTTSPLYHYMNNSLSSSSTTSSPLQSLINSTPHLTLYKPTSDPYLAEMNRNNNGVNSTHLSYNWYLFTTSTLINSTPVNSMSLTPQEANGVLIDDIFQRQNEYNNNMTGMGDVDEKKVPLTTKAIIQKLQKYHISNTSLYSSLDWIKSPLDLIQPHKANHDELRGIGEDCNGLSTSTALVSQTTPPTTISLLTHLEGKMAWRKHKPASVNAPGATDGSFKSNNNNNGKIAEPLQISSQNTTQNGTKPSGLNKKVTKNVTVPSLKPVMGLMKVAASSSEGDKDTDKNNNISKTPHSIPSAVVSSSDEDNSNNKVPSIPTAVVSSSDDDDNDDDNDEMKNNKVKMTEKKTDKNKALLLKQRNDQYRLQNSLDIDESDGDKAEAQVQTKKKLDDPKKKIKLSTLAASSVSSQKALPLKKKKVTSVSPITMNDNDEDYNEETSDGDQKVVLLSNKPQTFSLKSLGVKANTNGGVKESSTQGKVSSKCGDSIGQSNQTKVATKVDTNAKMPTKGNANPFLSLVQGGMTQSNTTKSSNMLLSGPLGTSMGTKSHKDTKGKDKKSIDDLFAKFK